MLTVEPIKNLNGKIELLPSQDLFVLASVLAIATRQSIMVSPAIDSPALRQWTAALHGHATCVFSPEGCTVTPVFNDPAALLIFPSHTIPHRDLLVFTLLGMGKTIAFKTASLKRLESWKRLAAQLGYTLAVEIFEQRTTLRLEATVGTVSNKRILEEAEIQPLLGLLLGQRACRSFKITSQMSNPLRTVATTFGFTIEVKSLQNKEIDPIARRLRMMQHKKQKESAGQLFQVNTDFTEKKPPRTEPIPVTLPGDEILSATCTLAKCLFPKSNLIISNVPLESWATPLLTYLRKMRCKVSVQESSRTSFGSTGVLHLQIGTLVGRKMACSPAVSYIPYLPAMVVVAAFAQGQSVLRDLADLRNDEPDGIELLEGCIRKLGARHGEMPDGIVLEGGYDFDGFDIAEPLPPACAAAFAVAGLRCMGTTSIPDEELLQRWPDFQDYLKSICEYRT